MAVKVWKDGVFSYVEAKRLQAHLANGYTLTDEPEKPKKKKSEQEDLDLEQQSDS